MACQPHHTVIDADVAYAVARLQAMKREHESSEHITPSETSSELFVAAVQGSSVYGNVTNVGTLNVYHPPVTGPEASRTPQFEFGIELQKNVGPRRTLQLLTALSVRLALPLPGFGCGCIIGAA